MDQLGMGKPLPDEPLTDVGCAGPSLTHSSVVLIQPFGQTCSPAACRLPCLSLDHFKNTTCTERTGRGSWLFVCNPWNIKLGEDWSANQAWAGKDNISPKEKLIGRCAITWFACWDAMDQTWISKLLFTGSKRECLQSYSFYWHIPLWCSIKVLSPTCLNRRNGNPSWKAHTNAKD